jgi:hypothetical protein
LWNAAPRFVERGAEFGARRFRRGRALRAAGALKLETWNSKLEAEG